ncbi:PA domain-containing protein [Kribbella sp. VKM Ac-2569]|uniref:S8 family serine peptidase n=1 Tax=Kribbella sp. VKM Ac-2569 TaxID=2512220 RepID=UPI00102B7891|nr:S8 family serine peptidase [Kribbella sp. VKM Ac-2569]RZT26731.1 PA domain-containing protein [Kribbella sp. VKM Ac-2569]
MRSPHHRRGHRRTATRSVTAGVSAGLLVAALLPAMTASAADPSPTAPNGRPWTATPLTVASTVNGAKSPSGQLAKSDPALVNSTSPKQVRVVVKLDYDSLAAYRGGIKGLPGTSPAVTGKRLDVKGANATKYLKHVATLENKFLAAMQSKVPSARAGQRLRTVYGGIALSVPANQARDLLKLPGVAAVQQDNPQQLLTDSSGAFIGAPTIYNQLGGSANSGKGVIVGVLDTGAWPEHPSFADPGGLPAPPPTADATPRVCDFGDNPLTPAADVFNCTNKLIGGRPFLDTYNAVIGGDVYPDSARDSNGHGTHTASTSAGAAVAHANPLGIDRGAVAGMAPAAAVSVYKVCGAEGCFPSDSAAAVARVILDGVRVINFSISGGSDPYSDPVELAFLDAYAAGVFVSASAGNSGPGAATTDHRGPWVTTVAASTQSRTFRSTVTLAGGGVTATVSGASITPGISSPLPVVLAGSTPGYTDATCNTPAPPGVFTGKIVACQFTPGRVMKGFNILQGGASGMLMYNSTAPSDVFTDNHWVPAVQLEKPDADALLAFLAAHPGTTATFTQGTKTTWQGDVMTSFSSRGPGGDFLKPDVTAPGLHIMAGATPTPESPAEGPPGNLYQVIAGTSMSSPHVAGSAALVLALHPSWTPGQIKSALETTAKTTVTKPDRTTQADPFDYGGGRIDLTKAGDPGLTLDETAANYATSATDPLNRIDLNLPSVNAPTMPGLITAQRTVTNVTNQTLTFMASGTTVSGANITVLPPAFQVKPGKSQKLTIAITAPDVPDGQYFGQVNLKQVGGSRALHLPVAFFRQEGIVPIDQTCAPSTIARNTGQSTCTVTVRNNSLQTTDVTAVSTLSSQLRLTSVTGATQVGPQIATKTATLAGREPDSPVIAPGSLAGYIPLDAFGIAPIPIGDEQALNFTVPPFTYAGQSYNRVGVTSNGYTVVGGTSSGDDVQFLPQNLPDPARPNNVLASYWTDLDGTGAPGIFAGTLTDGVSTWLVLEWRVNLFGTNSLKVFQQWIGVNGAEDITYAYDPGNLPGSPPAGYGLTVGAENFEGTAGSQIVGPPVMDYRITSTPGAPGGSMTYSMNIKGVQKGTGTVTTGTSTPLVKGVTIEVDKIIVN